MSRALGHIRVLELSRVLAGPWAAQTLGDLGAEVIKVERAGAGDDTRKWGPPFLKDDQGNDTAETAYFMAANRGKKSVAVDLSSARGQRLVRDLAAKSDVVIENFRVGGAARLGVGYDHLKAVNPSLIYCSISGFGQDGPYKDRGGYDFMIQALGGLMSITGERDDVPGGGPQKVGVAVSDLFAGMYATVAILTALNHRERTGEGQYIDVALLDCTAAILSVMASNYLVGGEVPGRLGNAHPNVVPYALFRAADGEFVVAVGNDGQFARLCQAVGRPELADDPRFRDNLARVRHRGELTGLLADLIATRPAGHWLAALAEANIPSAPVNSVDQVFADPQIVHRGIEVALPHSRATQAVHAGNPLRLSATPVAYGRSAPVLGEHTDTVLRDLLGLADDDIAALKADRVI